MLDVLRNTEGMVCVPLRLATRALARGYQSQNIQFAVYSVNDQATLDRAVANIDPDIIYVDNAEHHSPRGDFAAHQERKCRAAGSRRRSHSGIIDRRISLVAARLRRSRLRSLRAMH